MKFATKVAVITFSIFFALLITGVVLIVVLTRKKPAPSVSPTSPTPTPPLPTPPAVRNILLKDSSGLCFQFDNLQPVLGAPEHCTGVWIESPTNETLTYDGGTYETCIQPAVTSGNPVYGTIGAGCNGIVLDGTTIKSGTYCVNKTGSNITWGSCTTAFNFVVEPL